MNFITTRTLFLEAARIAAKRVKVIHPRPLVMRLDFDDGLHMLTHGAKPNFNSSQTGKIATDKDITVRVLNEFGLPTPASHFVTLTREKLGRVNDITHSQEYKDLLGFVERVKYPIFLKPNKGSQGVNVFCIRDEMGLKSVMQSTLRRAPGYFIAQEALMGEEYRIVVVQGHIELAYYRKPLSVVGDGLSTIQELVARQNNSLQKRGRHTNLKPNSEKISSHLAAQDLRLDTVPDVGRLITVLSNRNLSDGSEPVECTQMIRYKYGQLCRDIYEKGAVDYCGLDLIEDVRSGDIKPIIIEINSNPGYKHFIRSAPENPHLVRGVFVEAIHASHRKHVTLHAAARPNRIIIPSPSHSNGQYHSSQGAVLVYKEHSMLQSEPHMNGTHNGHNGAHHALPFAGAAIDVSSKQDADSANKVFTDVINPKQFDGVKGNDRIGYLRILLEDVSVVDRDKANPETLNVISYGVANRDKASRLMFEFLKSFDEIKQNFKKKDRGGPLMDAIRRMRSEMGLANHVAKNARVEVNSIPENKLTDNQLAYKAGLRANDCTIAEGPAGTGKTAIAIEVALELYNQGKISNIILVKPVALEKGENNAIGAVKGDMDEKFAPYFENIYNLFIERIGADRFAALCDKGIIKIKPFSMMRGQNFSGAFVIVDEAQNCSPKNIRTVMSRLADSHSGSVKPRIVLTGDLEQKDTPDSMQNGLLFALVHYTPARISNSMQIQFVDADIKRSKVAAEVHEANKKPDVNHPMYAMYCREFGISANDPTVPPPRTMIAEQPQPRQ